MFKNKISEAVESAVNQAKRKIPCFNLEKQKSKGNHIRKYSWGG